MATRLPARWLVSSFCMAAHFTNAPRRTTMVYSSCHRTGPKEVLLCSIREYRTGVLEDPRIAPSGYNYLSAQQALAIYRGSQDVRGLLRTIIYRQQVKIKRR